MIQELYLLSTGPKIWNIYSQKWNGAALFPPCISERFIYSHDRSYLESLFCCISWENSWLNRRSGEKGRELPLRSSWGQFPALLSAPACGWAESSHQWPTHKFPLCKITDHKWKHLIFVVNFFFGSEWMRFQIRHLYWILIGPSFAVSNTMLTWWSKNLYHKFFVFCSSDWLRKNLDRPPSRSSSSSCETGRMITR